MSKLNFRIRFGAILTLSVCLFGANLALGQSDSGTPIESSASAPPTTPTLVPPTPTQTETTPADGPSLESANDEPSALEALQRLGAQLKAPQNDTGSSAPTNNLDFVPTPQGDSGQRTPMANELPDISEERIHSIHERIKLIKSLIEKDGNPNEPTSESNGAANPRAVGAGQQPMLGTPELDPNANLTTPQNRGNDLGVPIPDPATDSSTTDAPGRGIPVTHPVNSFELANSLFLTGNYSASRKSYQAAAEDAGKNDATWLQLLIGCCYRLEGDLASAEAQFRGVSNEKGHSYPVDYAQWSLSYIQQRQDSERRFNEISKEIDAIVVGAKK